VGQFAVAALYERRKLLRNKVRRSQTAATATKLHHYPTDLPRLSSPRTGWAPDPDSPLFAGTSFAAMTTPGLMDRDASGITL